MRLVLGMAVGVCAMTGLLVAAPVTAEAKGKCSATTVQGEGLTPEIAKEMAKMNLDFTISSKGVKGSGPVQYKCGQGMLILSSCTAKQRTCS